MRFTTMLIILAALMAAAVLGDLLLRGRQRVPPPPTYALTGDPQRGRAAIIQHGCGACHVIPGIRNASGRVGPKLDDIARQTFIGGHVANTPDNLAAWIRNPKHFAPGTAMPDLNISEPASQDIAAYLYTRTRR
jgi:cytochrome c2